ncbi:reverse transcriptase domain-containing protein [Tanacetum coccineum]
MKLLDTGIIYPITDSPWASLIHCVPKKGGITVVTNENDELVPTRTITGWRVCIDYRKLNEATVKDHFPLLFMDQMLERLAGNKYFCFLDGFFGYFQIPIDPNDQEKTTFTCPFGTYAYRRMPFGLCNAPVTYQRYAHLVLNWEKCHFMVKKGIVLGHKVSSTGLEVDKAKIDVISKLPPPTNIKEFDIEIKDRKGTENVTADHLSRIENDKTSDDSEVDDNFPGETFMEIDINEPWFADFAKYLVIAVDYVSKWAEAQTLPTNDARVVVAFLKKLFCRFGMPKALISDRGTHFCNKIMEKTMKRYGVNHRFSTSYHPQTSGQVENTNRALKRILEKTVKDNPAIWSRKLDDALWAFRTAYKTPTGTTPYKLIYGKNCHLPFEIEHRAYWALKNYNPDLIAAGEKRMFQLHELDELRHQAYENSRLYKERTKVWHDKKLRMRKEFKQGNKVLLFYSKYKFKQPKLRSRWLGPYIVKHQYPSGYLELYGKRWKTFIVNGHQLYITKKTITQGKQSQTNDARNTSLANDSLKN